MSIIRWTLTSVFAIIHLLAGGQSVSWPIKATDGNGSLITVYEPQPETFSDNNITARAAVSVTQSGGEPVFGVMWFNALLLPDANQQTAAIKEVAITRVKFSDGEEANITILKDAINKALPLSLNLNRVKEMLRIENSYNESGIKNTPPVIYFKTKPTTLIVLDGDPIEQTDDDLKMKRVVNSPYLIVKNPGNNRYYLYGGSVWYSATQVKSGWAHDANIPAGIQAIDKRLKEDEKKSENKADAPRFSTPTDILVSTVPAEIIQTEGSPTYKPVVGTTLLYVDNTLDEIFKDVNTQKNYILLSGRWYNSKSLDGPWEYVETDALPAAFAEIPEGSEKDGVLTSVAGTNAAEEAIMDANIPQAAKVDRTSVTCTVDWDGQPKFVRIENTNLLLAENSSITVMQTPDKQYYALENGIWFKSDAPSGPWQVANERPSDVEKIPPSSSAYNSRYVYVYDVTPQYVYVGYTPGYLGCYHYRHTVIWGTGWHYHPWYGYRFFPRPYTWGFGMHYNPWTGWNISYGLSFNYGWAYFHHGHGYGWFGPPMYRPPYRPWGWGGGYYGHNRPSQRPPQRPNVSTNRPANWNTRPTSRPSLVQQNLYHNRPAVATRDKVQRPTVRPSNPNTGSARPTAPNVRPSNPNTGSARPTAPTVRPGTQRPGNNRPVTPPKQPSQRPAPKPTPSTRPNPKPSPQPRPTAKPAPTNKKPVTKPARSQPSRAERKTE